MQDLAFSLSPQRRGNSWEYGAGNNFMASECSRGEESKCDQMNTFPKHMAVISSLLLVHLYFPECQDLVVTEKLKHSASFGYFLHGDKMLPAGTSLFHLYTILFDWRVLWKSAAIFDCLSVPTAHYWVLCCLTSAGVTHQGIVPAFSCQQMHENSSTIFSFHSTTIDMAAAANVFTSDAESTLDDGIDIT